MKRFLADNGLSVAFGMMLVLALVGQAFAGHAEYNQSAQAQGYHQIDLLRYVTSSTFAVDVAENWQSEYLQFALYILLTVWLIQRGSSESKPLGQQGTESDEEQLVGAHAQPDSPLGARVGGWRTTVFSNSLLIMMTVIFLLSWFAQAVSGRVAHNEERLRDFLPPLDLLGYLASPNFWNRTLQNWQSELLAVGSMAIFSVFLRQRGSPESKKVGASHEETGSS